MADWLSCICTTLGDTDRYYDGILSSPRQAANNSVFQASYDHSMHIDACGFILDSPFLTAIEYILQTSVLPWYDVWMLRDHQFNDFTI